MPLYFFKDPSKNLKKPDFQHLTLVIPLRKLNKSKEDKLASCRHEFTRAVSYFLKQSRDLNTTSPYKLHKLFNQEARQKFNLPSAILQAARDRGVAIQRIYWARVKKRLPTSPPVIKKDLPLHLRQGSYKIFKKSKKEGGPFSWFIEFAYIPGRNKKLVLPMVVREYCERRLSQSSKNQFAACEIYRRSAKSGWFVSIIIKVPVHSHCLDLTGLDTFAPSHSVTQSVWQTISENKIASDNSDTFLTVSRDSEIYSEKLKPNVIGVDLGIRHNAVLSTGKFMGPRYLLRKYDIYARKKFSSASSDLKKSRFVSYISHLISRDIVDTARKEGAIIALEDLTGLKNRVLTYNNVFIRSLSTWSYRKLSNYVKYKSALSGVATVVIDPANTSSTCSRCGYVSQSNREIPGNFVCKFCGYELNPDLNAARMIAHFAQKILIYKRISESKIFLSSESGEKEQSEFSSEKGESGTSV